MKKDILVVVFVLFSFTNIIAQSNNAVGNINFSIPSVAILNIVTDNTISFSSPSQAGVIITPGASTSNWLNYSSIVTRDYTNKITVNISSGQLPESTSIKLETGADMGGGAGRVGTPVNEITLSESPQDIITGIGSCYTGTGMQKGHQLIYSWITDKKYNNSKVCTDNTIALTYTILAAD